jgi:hypothetical protein
LTVTLPFAKEELATKNGTFTGLQGLNRKEMEQERLARLKRKAEGEPERSRPVVKKVVSGSITKSSSRNSDQSPTVDLTSTGAIPYPRGVVRRTFSAKHPRKNDIKLEEILLKDQLKLGLVSSFMWDMEWFFKKINVKSTRFYMPMMDANNDTAYRTQCQNNAPPTVKLYWPSMEGAGNLHSKLMLLIYDKFMRIVVTSANMMDFDWGETGQLENMVFLIDLPRLEKAVDVNILTPFGQELYYFLQKSDAPDQVLSGLLKFDFTATEDLAFIHSVGGSTFGSDIGRTGYNSIAQAINQLKLQPKDHGNISLEYATASLGALNETLLQNIWNAARGIVDKGTSTKTAINPKLKDLVRVYFPSEETIRKSVGGPNSAGTICLNKTPYQKSTWPRTQLRDHISTQDGLLSHSKMILGHCESSAWAYIGSHNLTEAAWGKVSKDRQRNEYKMVCRNWECGVLIPVRKFDTEDKSLQSVFETILDIPFKIPGQAYAKERDPWFFQKGGHG